MENYGQLSDISAVTQNLPVFYFHFLATKCGLQISSGGNLCLAAYFDCLSFEPPACKKNARVDPANIYSVHLTYMQMIPLTS